MDDDAPPPPPNVDKPPPDYYNLCIARKLPLEPRDADAIEMTQSSFEAWADSKERQFDEEEQVSLFIKTGEWFDFYRLALFTQIQEGLPVAKDFKWGYPRDNVVHLLECVVFQGEYSVGNYTTRSAFILLRPDDSILDTLNNYTATADLVNNAFDHALYSFVSANGAQPGLYDWTDPDDSETYKILICRYTNVGLFKRSEPQRKMFPVK
jgi:hypothetical protein